MSNYSVIQRQVCTFCEGTGAIAAGIWQLYWEENPEGLATSEDDLAWFREQGWDVSRVADLPTEEEACVECAGTGEVCEEIPLLQALTDLGLLPALEDFVRGVLWRFRCPETDSDLVVAAEALLSSLTQAEDN